MRRCARKPVTPGDQLRVEVAPLRKGGAVWKFKAIYRDGNAQFGQFSDVLPVTVSGT